MLAAILSGLSLFLGAASLFRSRNRAIAVLLWPWKLLSGALAPFLGLAGAVGAILALSRGRCKWAVAGTLGAGLAARFVGDVPDPKAEFDVAFGPQWELQVPAWLQTHLLSRRWSLLSEAPAPTQWHRDLVYGSSSAGGKACLADLWLPSSGAAYTGLGVIFIHGGAWRLGSKDMGTRPFFRRLAGQGHVILDVNYSLCPDADIPAMVAEVRQAVIWMKENGPSYGVDPERIILMGGSAGGHLALLAAYTAEETGFRPPGDSRDVSVRGVVAFYPPADLLALRQDYLAIHRGSRTDGPPGLSQRAADRLMTAILTLGRDDPGPELELKDFLPSTLGRHSGDIDEAARLLSPSAHIGPDCPPTLLLQGSDDVFLLAPAVRCIHQGLRQAGVPTVLVEFPHTEHAFDLVLPRISPVAQVATYSVERFLALLI